MSIGWVTNFPEVAEALRNAEAKCAAARAAATDLPLAEKLDAYRRANAELAETCRTIKTQFEIGPRERSSDECPVCGSRVYFETNHMGATWVCTNASCAYEGFST